MRPEVAPRATCPSPPPPDGAFHERVGEAARYNRRGSAVLNWIRILVCSAGLPPPTAFPDPQHHPASKSSAALSQVLQLLVGQSLPEGHSTLQTIMSPDPDIRDSTSQEHLRHQKAGFKLLCSRSTARYTRTRCAHAHLSHVSQSMQHLLLLFYPLLPTPPPHLKQTD